MARVEAAIDRRMALASRVVPGSSSGDHPRTARQLRPDLTSSSRFADGN